MKILIVDDDKLIAKNIIAKITRAFPTTHIDFTAAHCVADALELFSMHDFNLIITDINMPNQNGLVLIENIRKIDKDVVIFVLSGYDTFDYVKKAFLLNINDYLLKPISTTELKEKITKYCTLTIKSNPVTADTDNSMQLAIQFIDDNIFSNISMQDVATHVNMSYNYFSKQFNDYTGLSYPNYILKIKMELAQEYLQNPTTKMKDISNKLGYANQNIFSRAFKKYTGMYPQEYKKNTQKD